MRFGPPRDGAGHVQMRCRRRAARQHKTGQWRKPLIHCVDLALQPFHLGGGDPQRILRLPAVFRHAQVGAQVEQVVLDAPQHGVHAALRVQAFGGNSGDADGGIGLVHRADGGDAQAGLGNPAAVAQPGFALISAARIDFIEPYHVPNLSLAPKIPACMIRPS